MLVSLRKTLCYTVTLFAVFLAVAGCGGAHSSGISPGAHVRGPKEAIPLIQSLSSGKYTSYGSWTLVREGIPGGYVSITGKRYRLGRRIYSTLAGRIERLGEPIVSSGGLPLESSATPVLQMAVYRGCAGSHLYALAYGLLHKSEDMVTVSDGRLMVVVKRIEIPTSFYPGSVLVYALLDAGANNIVARTADGQIVDNITYIGRDTKTVVCHS